ncbi:cysteine hydrolase family protein [Planctomycetota bacterium]
MIRQLIRSKRRRVLVDINTQRDYFLAEGSACIRNHRRVLANVRRMMAWARSRGVVVISTCEVFVNDNGGSEIDYCLEGTEGQKKIGYTVLDNHIDFAADDGSDFPSDILWKHRQIILNKRCIDPFEEPRLERLLSEVRASEFVLIGADAESAVEATALGLLQRGKKVCIVTDAVGSKDKRKAKLAFRKMHAKGARLIEAKKLAGTSHLKHVGICKCQNCQQRLHSNTLTGTHN